MAYQPKSYKKFVATAATATLVASAIVPVASAADAKSFTDVSSNYKAAVDYLVANGITQGTSDTTFGTGLNIQRGDAAVFIARALGLDVDNAKDQGFKDLNTRVAKYVNAIVEAGIAGGKSDTKFDAGANITRQEMAKMLANAYELTATTNAGFKDVNSNWIGYVSALKESGITVGKTESTFAPTANLTRGEFALFMHRAELQAVPAVTAVSATGPKTLTVSGKYLKKLQAADVTVAGNKVLSVTPAANGKTATVALESNLTPGLEYKVTVKTDGKTTDYTVKFTFDVKTATIATTTIDANKAGQKIALNVDGSAADLDYLVNAAGWSVQFQSDTGVFVQVGTGDTFTSSTGEIDPALVNINDTFKVKAVLTKLGVTVETPTVEVRVVDEVTPVIGSLVLEQAGSIGEMNSKTLVTGENAAITGVLSNTDDTIAISGSASFESSNVGVATISSSGVISAIAPGKTTITVTAGKEKYTTEITVSNVARTASKVVPARATIAVAPGVVSTVNVDVLDQYGDLVATNNTEVAVSSDLAVTPLSYSAEGEATLNVTASTTAKTYTVYFKNGTQNIGQFNVSVSADNVGAVPRLELKSGSKNSIAQNTSTTLNANLYTRNGGFTESLTGAGGLTLQSSVASSDTYTIEVANPAVASVTITGSDIVVASNTKVGSTEIVLKKGSLQVAKFVVTVTDSAVRVTAVDWKAKNNTITNKDKAITLKDALNIQTSAGNDDILNGLTISKATTSKVRITNISGTTADVYLDKNDNGSLDAGEELGLVTVSLTNATNLTLGNLPTLATTVVGDKGTFIFTFTDTVNGSKVLTSTTLNVDVK